MQDKMEMLRKQLEDKVLKKRPYNEIYEASLELDEAINNHYNQIVSEIIRKQ